MNTFNGATFSHGTGVRVRPVNAPPPPSPRFWAFRHALHEYLRVTEGRRVLLHRLRATRVWHRRIRRALWRWSREAI